MLNIVCKDSNSKLYTVVRCLLPSEKLAIFDTILSTMIPTIIGKKTCSNINLVTTDGDSQEIKACQNACKHVFNNAQHINCMWHLINRSIRSSKVIYHPRLKDIIKHWLNFTAKEMETHEEIKQSLAYMKVSITIILCTI